MGKTDIGIDLDFNGNSLLNMGEQSIDSSAIISPVALAVIENNYNPTSLQIASVLMLTAPAVSSISGITAPDTTRAKILTIINSGDFNITILNNSSLSVAVNRFDLNSAIIIGSKTSVTLIYNTITSKWIVYSSHKQPYSRPE